MPERPDGYGYAWAQYTLKVKDRNGFQDKLKQAGIPTMIYYPTPLHLQKPYAPHADGPGSLPVCESLCDQVVSLPMHPYMADDDAKRIVDVCRTALA